MKVKKLLCLGLAAAISCPGLPVQAANAQETAIGKNEKATESILNAQSDTDEGFTIREGRLTSYYGEDFYQDEDFVIRKGCLISYDGEGSDVVIPEGVTSIGEDAFRNSKSMVSVTIPEGVAYIERCAFQNCANLASVTIPERVTNIAEYAFKDCTNLKKVTLRHVTFIGRGAFSYCTSLTDINLADLPAPEDPENESTCICEWAFEGCSSLKNVTLSKEITHIEAYTFEDCTSLESVFIPENVYAIDKGAFLGCTSLKSVSIPQKTRTIGETALGYYYNNTANDDGTYDGPSPVPGFLIQGYPGSAAETYAKANNFEFVALKDDTPTPPATTTPTPPATTTPTPAPETGRANISKATITLPQSTYTYTGKPIAPPVTAAYGGKVLSPGRDYAIAYTDNINAGTGKITLTGIGGYQGSVTKAFTIGKAGQAISGTKSYQKAYGGKAFTLNAKRTAGDGALSYSSSAPKVASVSQKGKVTIKGTGVATITVTAKETANYATQKFQVEVRVSPKKPTLSALKPKGGRKLAVSWKRDTSATGYEVWCSTSKSFKKGLKKNNVKGNKVTSCQFSKLNVGKKYYVRLRSYKTVKENGKTIVLRSKWSSVKQSKKIKK